VRQPVQLDRSAGSRILPGVKPGRRGGLVGFGSRPALTLATGAFLILALALGGSSQKGLWSDAIVQIAGLGLLAVLLPRIIGEKIGSGP
jgi:hypothetical protein